jgi:hypothetical protein
MAGSRLFRPNEGLDVRNPLSNKKENKNIINPPRFAEFGGLAAGGARGIYRNDKTISSPGGTQKTVPQRNRRTTDS